MTQIRKRETRRLPSNQAVSLGEDEYIERMIRRWSISTSTSNSWANRNKTDMAATIHVVVSNSYDLILPSCGQNVQPIIYARGLEPNRTLALSSQTPTYGKDCVDDMFHSCDSRNFANSAPNAMLARKSLAAILLKYKIHLKTGRNGQYHEGIVHDLKRQCLHQVQHLCIVRCKWRQDWK